MTCLMPWARSKKSVSISNLQLISWVNVFEKLRCMGSVYWCLYMFACWFVGLFDSLFTSIVAGRCWLQLTSQRSKKRVG